MLRIDRVLETALYVEEMGRAVEFYQRIFGFPVLAENEHSSHCQQRVQSLSRHFRD